MSSSEKPSPLEDRRQSAREAYWDTNDADCLDAALEIATRVKITPEVIDAFIRHPDQYEEGDVAGPLRTAFEAAGFEVIE